MKLTLVNQMCKNIFAIKMVLIILTFHGQDLTKGCWCMSRNDRKSILIELCVFIMLLTFSNKVEKCFCMRFVNLSVCSPVISLILINILQMPWNLCMLFIFNMEWTALKMIYKGLKVRLQRYTKIFRYIAAYGGGRESLKGNLHCSKCDEIQPCHSDIQKHTSYKNND